MKYDTYEKKWYEGAEYGAYGASRGTGKRSFGKTSYASILLAMALCASASYMAGGIIGANGLSADDIPQTPPSFNEDASYVMSWDFGDDTDNTDSEDTTEDAEHKARIEALAEEYIESHSVNGKESAD